MKKKIFALIFTMVFCFVTIFPSIAHAKSDFLPDNINRISGKDRIYTAIEISKENFDNANYVILATSEDFPDALISTSLAKSLNAPILLTRSQASDNLEDAVINEINRLNPAKVYIIGGASAVTSMAESLLSFYETERIDGTDQYQISANVAEELKAINGQFSTVFIASGEKFPDALSITAAAGKNPILLSRGDYLSQEVEDLLATNFIETILAKK